MPLERPRTVTFDCWSTVLYESDPAAAQGRRVEMVCEYAARSGSPVDEDRASEVLRLTWDRFDERWRAESAPTPDDLARWILEFVGAPDTSVAGELSHTLATQALERRILTLDGAERALRVLKSEDVRLGLVCDTGYSPGSTLRRVLARLGLLHYFEVTSFSNEVGVPKPHPLMFERTLDMLGSPAIGSVHVGDLKRTDIAGARRIGMHTVRITAHNDDRSEHDEADAVVESHDDLLAILGFA